MSLFLIRQKTIQKQKSIAVHLHMNVKHLDPPVSTVETQPVFEFWWDREWASSKPGFPNLVSCESLGESCSGAVQNGKLKSWKCWSVQPTPKRRDSVTHKQVAASSAHLVGAATRYGAQACEELKEKWCISLLNSKTCTPAVVRAQ